MSNHVVKLLKGSTAEVRKMENMQFGELCVVTAAPEECCIRAGEPVVRTMKEFYFLSARKYCMASPESANGYYVRDLTADEEICITRK